MHIENKIKYYHFLGLLVLIYLVIFLKLDCFHMRWWDESMFAVNTYEMMHNHHYFTPYFNHTPDLFNTKPPLTSWIQIGFVKILGYNELAMRLPSAIAASFTTLLLFSFISKYFNILCAWCVALVLLTSNGYIGYHTARTGEADSLLTFFVISSLISLLNFVIEGKRIHVIIYFIFMTLAISTKLFAALLFLPAIIYVLFKYNKFRSFVLNSYFVLGLLICVGFNAIIILLREQESPGYLHELLFKDAGRLLTVVERHNEPITFYIDNLFYKRFSLWSIFLIFGLLFIASGKKDNLFTNEPIILCSVSYFLLSYLTIISISTTKLEWYDMPLYPLFSVIVGYLIFNFIGEFLNKNNQRSDFFLIIIFICIFIWPYSIMFRKSQANPIHIEEQQREACEIFIHEKIQAGINLDKIHVVKTIYSGSLLFYKYVLLEKKQELIISSDLDFNPNDKVLICNDSLFSVLKRKYEYSIIEESKFSTFLKINKKFID